MVVAPNAFKGALSAIEAAEAISTGLLAVDPSIEVDLAPVSDGGDGFLDSMLVATGARRFKVVVRGPVHSPVAAALGLRAGERPLALVEAAQAAGLALLDPSDLDPLDASTGGVGELMNEARRLGATAFLVGVGGTATTDGGTGLARALGYRFLDGSGAELPEGGGHLHRLERIDSSGFDPSWLMLEITVACDVDNPLTGPQGAAAVYGPQKGADPAQVKALDAGLTRLAAVVASDLGVDISALPGAGAAGGLAGGLVAFLGAQLRPGATSVIEALGLRARLAGAGLVVTAEGRLDAQSLHGKAPVVVGRLARSQSVRAAALVGSVGPGWESALGDAFDEVRVISPAGLSTEAAMRATAESLRAAASALVGASG